MMTRLRALWALVTGAAVYHEWECSRGTSYAGPCDIDNPTPYPSRHVFCGPVFVILDGERP